jgi:hypothetical protein
MNMSRIIFHLASEAFAFAPFGLVEMGRAIMIQAFDNRQPDILGTREALTALTTLDYDQHGCFFGPRHTSLTSQTLRPTVLPFLF